MTTSTASLILAASGIRREAILRAAARFTIPKPVVIPKRRRIKRRDKPNSPSTDQIIADAKSRGVLTLGKSAHANRWRDAEAYKLFRRAYHREQRAKKREEKRLPIEQAVNLLAG